MSKRLYWLGNSAKTKVLQDILARARGFGDKRFTIFDYGCGTGGDWAAILSEHPRMTYLGYDSSEQALKAARARLAGLNARLATTEELERERFAADFIVSFSVLEHVYDRPLYLKNAKRHLGEGGVLYLNYDDGHFRNQLDLNAPDQWPRQLKEWLHNVLAVWLGRAGAESYYQERVERTFVDSLVRSTGFRVLEEFYSNLESLKDLYKTMPSDKREDFSRFWLKVEEELNARFGVTLSSKTLGDNVSLWGVMASRTLVLSHQ